MAKLIVEIQVKMRWLIEPGERNTETYENINTELNKHNLLELPREDLRILYDNLHGRNLPRGVWNQVMKMRDKLGQDWQWPRQRRIYLPRYKKEPVPRRVNVSAIAPRQE